MGATRLAEALDPTDSCQMIQPQGALGRPVRRCGAAPDPAGQCPGKSRVSHSVRSCPIGCPHGAP
jgi:hypothetical protein